MTTRRVLEEQLAPALALRLDLVVAVSGTNDLLRRRFDAARLRAEIESIQRPLRDAGATLITFTLPDLSAVMPLATILRPRLVAMNEAIRAASAATGAIVCDMAAVPMAADSRLWSADRLHANAAGHARIAAALAQHLALPGSDGSWAEPLPGQLSRRRLKLVRAELAWIRGHFAPWLWRHARGISSGDGIRPKRPSLAPWP